MVTASELVVAIKSEGTEQATSDLESVEDAVDETADSASDSAEEFEEFSQRFQGAMSAALAGMAIAVGGLLSMVPILGEFAAGLGAIFAALGLQVDQLIRDLGGGGLTGFLFDVANAIYEADGAVGDLIGTLAVLGTVVTGASLGVAAWAVKTMGARAAAAAFAAKLGGLVSALGALPGVTVAGAVAVGALLGLLGVAALEIAGVTQKVEELGEAVGSGLPDAARDGLLVFMSVWTGPLAVVGGAILGFVRGFLEGGLDEGLSQSVEHAQEVLDIFAGAWDRTLDRVGGVISDFIEWLQGVFDTEITMGVSVGDVVTPTGVQLANAQEDGGGGGGGGGGRTGTPGGADRFRNTGGTSTRSGGSQIDGRQLSESTGRYRSDPSRRQGL